MKLARSIDRCIVHTVVLWFLIYSSIYDVKVCAQEEAIVFEIDLAEGLIYFLLTFFFLVNWITPIARWIYDNFLEELVQKASKEMEKVQKRMSEKLNDASRRTMQSIRTSTSQG